MEPIQSPSGLFYIQCVDDVIGNYTLWWRPERCGYTDSLDKAGKYPEEEARQIERGRKSDKAWPVEQIDALANRAVRYNALTGQPAGTEP